MADREGSVNLRQGRAHSVRIYDYFLGPRTRCPECLTNGRADLGAGRVLPVQLIQPSTVIANALDPRGRFQ